MIWSFFIKEHISFNSAVVFLIFSYGAFFIINNLILKLLESVFNSVNINSIFSFSVNYEILEKEFSKSKN